MELKLKKRNRKKNGVLKACRDCLKELEEVRKLTAFLRRLLKKSLDEGDSLKLVSQASKVACAEAHKPCRVPVEDVTTVLSPLVSPVTRQPPSQAFASSPCPKNSEESAPLPPSLNASQPPKPFLALKYLSSGHPDSEAGPPSPAASLTPLLPNSTLTFPWYDPRARPRLTIPHMPWPASPVRIISGVGHSSSPISTLSWWQVATKTWNLSTSTRLESQPEHLSQPPPGSVFWEVPTSRQVATTSLSFIHPQAQKMLEILITKRVELQMWKKKEKERSEDHLSALGDMFQSLGSGQHTGGHPPFWNPKGKGSHLLQKDSQLFWGLPFMHSESLVAAVRVAASPLELPSVPLNQVSNAVPAQEEATYLPQAPTLAHPAPPAPLLTSAVPQFQPPPQEQVPTQACFVPSFPILPASPPPQTGCCEVSCTMAQNKAQSFIPNSVQNLESHLLKKRLDSGRAGPLVVKKSQEIFNKTAPSFPQDIRDSQAHQPVSIFPEDPISPAIQEQLERNLQTQFLQQQDDLPCGIYKSLDLKHTQDQVSGVHQAQCQQGPSEQPVLPDQSIQDAQEIEAGCPVMVPLGMDLGTELGRNVGRILRDLYSCSEGFPRDGPGAHDEKSQADLRRPSRSSTTALHQKHSENTLRALLGRTVEQVIEGRICMDVHGSGLVTSHAFPLPEQSSTCEGTRSPAPSTGQVPSINTCLEVPVLRSHTWKVLEAHVVRLWVRHRWHLLLKVLKFINLLKLKKAHLSPDPRPVSPYNLSEAHSKAKLIRLLGKPPNTHLGEKLTTKQSVPILVSIPPAPSAKSEESQVVLGGTTPPGDSQGPLEAPLTGQDRSLSQPFTHTLVGRLWHSETTLMVERDDLVPSPSSVTTGNKLFEDTRGQTSRDSYCSAEILELDLGYQSSRIKEDLEEEVKIQEVPHWEVTLEPSVLLQGINLKRSNSPISRKSPLSPTKSVTQDSEDSCLDEWLIEFESQRPANQIQEYDSGALLQDCETGVLLQDCATETLLQDCHSDMLLAADMLASQGLPSDFQCVSRCGNTQASWELHDLASHARSNQEQWELPSLQDPLRSQGKGRMPSHERKGHLKPRIGEHEQRFAEPLKVFQTIMMSSPSQDKKSKSLRNKICHQPMHNGQILTESLVIKKLKNFLQWIFPGKDKEGKGPEDPLLKGSPASATAQSQGATKSRLLGHSGNIEAQELMTAIRRILEEKMAYYQGQPDAELNRGHKAPGGEHFCYHKVLAFQEQRRVINDNPYSHQTTTQAHNCPVKNRWTQDRIFSHKEPGSPVRPCQHRQRVAGVPGHHPLCPRHCLFQHHTTSSQYGYASSAFPVGDFRQEKTHTLQNKTIFSHISTSSTC